MFYLIPYLIMVIWYIVHIFLTQTPTKPILSKWGFDSVHST